MLTQVIPSYLYTQYNDDDSLQAFVSAFNGEAQEYVDWLNSVGLPVYTGAPIQGALLDWVGTGLYGLPRPVLPSGTNQSVGTLNTWALNTVALNTLERIGPTSYYATNDDVYKRILTWFFYKGDGQAFTIKWLKRRIMRFLLGVNGTDPGINQTYQVSVTFGSGNQVNITILNGMRRVTGGAILNAFTLKTVALNTIQSTFTAANAPLVMAPVLQAAINAGAVQLPFQFTYNVVIE